MKEDMFRNLAKNIKEQVEKLEVLDIYTNKHIHNVPRITLKLCEKLGIGEDKTRFYMNCAYLHDIGKIFTPHEILQKPEKLTNEEYEIMKQHTVKGYELCMAHEDLKKYAKAVKYHHENEDGTGYPEKLKGNEIPVEAKIVKVADIYDAISSRRQYKPEIKRLDAIKIIEEEVKKGKVNSKIFNALIDVAIDEIREENGEKEEINELEKMKIKGFTCK